MLVDCHFKQQLTINKQQLKSRRGSIMVNHSKHFNSPWNLPKLTTLQMTGCERWHSQPEGIQKLTGCLADQSASVRSARRDCESCRHHQKHHCQQLILEWQSPNIDTHFLPNTDEINPWSSSQSKADVPATAMPLSEAKRIVEVAVTTRNIQKSEPSSWSTWKDAPWNWNWNSIECRVKHLHQQAASAVTD